jgi:hypothetical protein
MNDFDRKEQTEIMKENKRLQKRLNDLERKLYSYREYRNQDDNPKTTKAKETIKYLKQQLELQSRKMQDEEKKLEGNVSLKIQKIDNKIEDLKEDIEAYRRKKEAEISELEKQKEMIESDKDIKLDRIDNSPQVKYYIDEISRRDMLLMEGQPKTRAEIQLEAEISALKEQMARGDKRCKELSSYVCDPWSCHFANETDPHFSKCEGHCIRAYPRQSLKGFGYPVCKTCVPIAATQYYCRKCKCYKYASFAPKKKGDDYECCIHEAPAPPPVEEEEPVRNEIVEPRNTFKIKKKATIAVASPPSSIIPPPDDYESVSTFNSNVFEAELEAAKNRHLEETQKQEAEVDKKFNKAMEEYTAKKSSLKTKETELRAEEDKIYKEAGHKPTDEYYKVKKQRQKVEEEARFLKLPKREEYYPPMDYSSFP